MSKTPLISVNCTVLMSFYGYFPFRLKQIKALGQNLKKIDIFHGDSSARRNISVTFVFIAVFLFPLIIEILINLKG